MKQSARKAATVRRVKPPSPQAILRAVASSTAIETGQSIAQIERRLRSKQRKFAHVGLAR